LLRVHLQTGKEKNAPDEKNVIRCNKEKVMKFWAQQDGRDGGQANYVPLERGRRQEPKEKKKIGPGVPRYLRRLKKREKSS